MSCYSFPGMEPFLLQAAHSLGFEDHYMIHQARRLWPVGQVQNALGQVKPDMAPEAIQGIMKHVAQLRASLAIALETVDAATSELCLEFEIPFPPFLKDNRDAAGHLCNPDDPGVGDDPGPAQDGRAEARPGQARHGKPRKG